MSLKIKIMQKNFIVLIASLFFTACTAQKKTGESEVKIPIPSDIQYLKMHRSACFGRCPTYSIEVYKNGLVRFTGIKFTQPIGIYEKNMGSVKVQNLFSEFSVKKVDTCKDVYDLHIADLPGIYYTFEYPNKTKKINNAHFGPQFLKDLANEVDSIGQVNGTWKKISDEPLGD